MGMFRDVKSPATYYLNILFDQLECWISKVVDSGDLTDPLKSFLLARLEVAKKSEQEIKNSISENQSNVIAEATSREGKEEKVCNRKG